MAKTIQNLVDETRMFVQDERDPFRYSTAKILMHVNRAFERTNALRPDAFSSTYDDTVLDVVVPTYTEGDLATEFPLHLMFYAPVLEYVVAAIEVTDDEYTESGRAAMLMSRFSAQLLTPL